MADRISAGSGQRITGEKAAFGDCGSGRRISALLRPGERTGGYEIPGHGMSRLCPGLQCVSQPVSCGAAGAGHGDCHSAGSCRGMVCGSKLGFGVRIFSRRPFGMQYRNILEPIRDL